jgi:hypothetical protein
LRVFRETRVHSDVQRVTFFTKVQKLSWKRIVGVNPLPRGASVGELGKILAPSKRRIVEIHLAGSRNNLGKDSVLWRRMM